MLFVVCCLFVYCFLFVYVFVYFCVWDSLVLHPGDQLQQLSSGVRLFVCLVVVVVCLLVGYDEGLGATTMNNNDNFAISACCYVLFFVSSPCAPL